MRGTLDRPVGYFRGVGIIPAYAGNTVSMNPVNWSNGDHPRVCGEHLARGTTPPRQSGSSPRMRGTHDVLRLSAVDSGIIPAYAGNTRASRARFVLSWDHPRVCGEHIIAVPFALGCMGSSPRMRGTLSDTVRIASVSGIIPAYAGNTLTLSCNEMKRRDHPRVCGEHTKRL